VGDASGVFVYTAQNASAEELGALVAQASGSGQTTANSVPVAPERAVRRINGVRAGSTGADAQPAASQFGALTVDAAGNRIIFRGAPSEFERLRDLLEQLDTPPQQVLVELTIAEVTLTDDTRFGVEWFLDQTITDGAITASTLGAATRQAGGLGITATHIFSRGRVQAALNAFASNRNLNILSTPRLVARSGSSAEILIGTDVPIITSQRASNSQSGGDSDILQTVQYRQTGVILNVRPVVYGDGRIDISLYQEVSSQQPNTTAAISSPLILNRSVTTKLSLEEGMTAVIGGLIQDNYTRDQRGVPGLKDIPLLGSAFRSDQVSGDKVELLILVTPYIIRDGEEMAGVAERMAQGINRTMRRRGPQVFTLLPWRAPFARADDHRSGVIRPQDAEAGAETKHGPTQPPRAR
jgi:general secretion pathway protein D